MNKAQSTCRRRLAAALRDDAGAVLIYVALTAPIFVGMVGLAVDVVGWQAEKRRVQTIADAAAIAGALERMRSGSSSPVEGAALIDAENNGYDPDRGDVIVVYHPPQSGLRVDKTDSVEVVVRRPVPALFSGLFIGNTNYVSARAVAVGEINDTCVWSLNKTAKGGVKVSGGALVDLVCGIFDNSGDSEGLIQSGAGCLSTSSIKIVGGYTADCISSEPITGANPIDDPLASLQPPDYDPICDVTAKITVNSGQSRTVDPGTYCAGIDVISDGSVYFNPGLYVFDGAGLKVSAQAFVEGYDVNFYLTENAGAADNIAISAGAEVTLIAGIQGDMAGILFYADRAAPANVTHSLTGGASMELEGIIYFPSQDLKFAGGSAFDLGAVMMIADTVDISGNTNLGDFDGSAVQSSNLLIETALVE